MVWHRRKSSHTTFTAFTQHSSVDDNTVGYLVEASVCCWKVRAVSVGSVNGKLLSSPHTLQISESIQRHLHNHPTILATE